MRFRTILSFALILLLVTACGNRAEPPATAAPAVIDTSIPAPVLTTSLYERFSSRGQNAFAARLNAALRAQFGGHAVKEKAKS